MTASTLPLLVLIAFLWWRTKGELLPIIIFTAIFDAASALNIGNTGLPPWILALAICLPLKVVTGKLNTRRVPGLNRSAYFTLVFFVGYSIFTSFVFPFLFHGIPVSNARNGLNFPLSWTQSNFSQASFLLCSLVVFLIAVHSTREQMRSAVKWYIYSCICIACFSMYQLANAVLHIPYPSAILYTNPTHVIYDAYKIAGVWRLNSTLNEASEAAFYMGPGLALLSWELVTRRIRWQTLASFLLVLTALVLTVSTTGYACLATIGLGGIFFAARRTFGKRGVAPLKLILLLAVLTTIIPLLLVTNFGHTVSKVFDSVFINKVDSESYRERSLWNDLALQSAKDTYYMGAGWGSVRASSFICSLLGGIGLPGTLLFFYFLYRLARPALSPRRYAHYDLYDRSLFAIAVMMVALALAGADPVEPLIWMLFGVAAASKPRASFPVQYSDGAEIQTLSNPQPLVRRRIHS
jgi:O-antigen ligase